MKEFTGKRQKNWRSLHYTFYYPFILTDILAELTIFLADNQIQVYIDNVRHLPM
jgi:hypothetical protein